MVDLVKAGLPSPSVIRTAKIATIEAADAERLGKVSARIRNEALRHVATVLGIAVER